jgi:DNA-binding response OmpR family regulator
MKKTILVVDDEDSVLDLLHSILTDAGFGVLSARNGFEAMKLAIKKELDLVIMDLMMPSMNGVDAIRAIKMSRPDLPIMILTGLPHDPMVEEGLKAGACRVIFKPVTPGKVIECIEELLGTFKPES